jgi:hypothetical protein
MKTTLAGLDTVEGKAEADEAADAVAALSVKSEETVEKKEEETA